MKAFKVLMSGSYKSQEGKLVNYNGIEVTIPTSVEEMAEYLARARYIHMALKQKIKEKFDIISEYYIDELKEVEANFSCVGKLITDLNDEELQDFAALHDLRSIPLYKEGSIREAQKAAIIAYAAETQNLTIKEVNELKQTEFRILKELNIKVPAQAKEVVIEKEVEETALSKLQGLSSNDSAAPVATKTPENNAAEFKGTKLEELKYQADALNIVYDDNIHYATLKKLVDEKMSS